MKKIILSALYLSISFIDWFGSVDDDDEDDDDVDVVVVVVTALLNFLNAKCKMSLSANI